jgi:transposase
MNTFWIGIDVSKLKLDVACLDGRGKVKSRVFKNDGSGHAALSAWIAERGADTQATHVCMESTGTYSEAPAIALSDAGWKVSVVNPLRVKGFAESAMIRNKTDQSDSVLLARYCFQMSPDIWQPPSLEQRKLRALVDRVQALKDMQQQERNRLEGQGNPGSEDLVKSIAEHLEWLRVRIDELERQIDDHIDGTPSLKNDAALMRSIPGVGPSTTARMLAYLGDVRRFSSSKALAAFIGVTPRQKQSGTSVKGRTMISRLGHGYLRQALFMPAMVAVKHNPAIKAFAVRLRGHGMSEKAIVGASMHKLVQQLYGVVRSGLPFDPRMAAAKLDLQVSI